MNKLLPILALLFFSCDDSEKKVVDKDGLAWIYYNSTPSFPAGLCYYTDENKCEEMGEVEERESKSANYSVHSIRYIGVENYDYVVDICLVKNDCSIRRPSKIGRK